jgi:t-SNARE complex subunit (syntaxin)
MSDSDALLDALRRHANEEKSLRAERRDNLYCALFIFFVSIIVVCCIVVPVFFM